MSSLSKSMKKHLKLIREKPKVVLVPIAVIILLLGTHIFSSDAGVLGNVIIITIIAISAPYFILSYLNFARIREIEDKFPQFLRDVADSVKSGSSLPSAVKAAAATDYGRLSPEVKKMAHQLSWGVTFPRTIHMFMRRMKASEIITRSMTILLEAYNAGGNITPILTSVANSVVTIKEAEYEKKSLLKEHVVMMYAIFFIFIGITMALTGILLPIIDVGGGASGSSSTFGANAVLKGGNPCDVCRGFQCMVCDSFTGIGKSMGFGEGVQAYYKALFFLMIMVQAIFSGLVAGQIGEDSLKAGVKHSMIMLGSGFAIFMIAIRFGII